MKYCPLIEVFSFNTINQLLIDRVKGPSILMQCLIKYTKHLTQENTKGWEEQAKFTEMILHTISCCLRLNRGVLPFIKDTKKFYPYILNILKSNIKNKGVTLKCLTIIKLLLLDEQCYQLLINQFQSLTILLLQIIDYNQDDMEIVRCGIICFRNTVAGGKVATEEQTRKALSDVLAKPQLKSLRAVMEQYKKKEGLKTQDELLDDLNRDIFTLEIQMPSHVEISDKYLIKVEKYLKELRNKYNAAKKSLANKTFFAQE